MIKILIGNENTADNLSLSQFLANDKKFIIENTYDGTSTLNKYIEIEPDILILNSNFGDLNYINIIDHLCSLPEKKYKNNIILILNNFEEFYELNDYSKLFKVLKNDYTFEDIAKTVKSLSLKLKKPVLTVKELNIYLDQLCFPPHSQCTRYTRTAILHCYKHRESLTSLQNIYNIVAKIYRTEPKTIREGIRKSLQPLSNFTRFNTTNLILQIFETDIDNVTPTSFFNKFIDYLDYVKQQK